MEWTSPVNAQLILVVAVVCPNAIRRTQDDRSVDVVRRCALQHLQVAYENTLELGCVWLAIVRLAEIMDNQVGVGQGFNGSFGDPVR